MKNKRLIIIVSIVILLVILNVAFYTYIRINNLKGINKEQTDYQEAKETSFKNEEVTDFNKTAEMYNQYYEARVEYEKEAEIKREQEEKKKQEEAERKQKEKDELMRKQEEEKKRFEEEARKKVEEQERIRLEQEKKETEDEIINSLYNIEELKDLVKAIHQRLNDDVCNDEYGKGRTPSEEEYNLLARCAAVFEKKAKTINDNEDLKLDITDLASYLKDGGNNKNRDKIVLAHRMSHDLDYHYFHYGSSADLFCVPRSIKVRPIR